jgi:hypothetical protein
VPTGIVGGRTFFGNGGNQFPREPPSFAPRRRETVERLPPGKARLRRRDEPSRELTLEHASRRAGNLDWALVLQLDITSVTVHCAAPAAWLRRRLTHYLSGGDQVACFTPELVAGAVAQLVDLDSSSPPARSSAGTRRPQRSGCLAAKGVAWMSLAPSSRPAVTHRLQSGI